MTTSKLEAAQPLFNRSLYVISLVNSNGDVYQAQAVFYEIQEAMFEIYDIACEDFNDDVEEWHLAANLKDEDDYQREYFKNTPTD